MKTQIIITILFFSLIFSWAFFFTKSATKDSVNRKETIAAALDKLELEQQQKELTEFADQQRRLYDKIHNQR